MTKHGPRIVSLVPSLTETLSHFGLMNNIAGCTNFCTEPRKLRHTVPAVGGTKDARIKDILDLRPTHVVVNREENTQAILNDLHYASEKCPFEIIETFPEMPEDNFQLIELLGEVFGFAQLAADWNAVQMDKLTELKQKMRSAQHFSFAYFIWMNPWMVAGNQTYISNTLALIKGQNNFETGSDLRERYPCIQSNDPRLKNTQVMMFSSEPFPFKNRHIEEFRRQSENLRPCLKVDGQALSWYGSRFSHTITYLGRLHADIQKALG